MGIEQTNNVPNVSTASSSLLSSASATSVHNGARWKAEFNAQNLSRGTQCDISLDASEHSAVIVRRLRQVCGERELLITDIQELVQEKQFWHNKCRYVLTEMQTLEQKSKAILTEKEAVTRNYNEKCKEIADLRQRSADHENCVRRQEITLREIERLTAMTNAMSKENKELEKQVKNLQDRMRYHFEKFTKLKDELHEAMKARDAAGDAVRKMEIEKERWKDQCSTAYTELQKARILHEELGRVHIHSQHELERLQDELITLRQALRTQACELAAHEREARLWQQRAEQLAKAVDQVQERMHVGMSELREQLENRDCLLEEQRKHIDEMPQIRADLECLKYQLKKAITAAVSTSCAAPAEHGDGTNSRSPVSRVNSDDSLIFQTACTTTSSVLTTESQIVQTASISSTHVATVQTVTGSPSNTNLADSVLIQTASVSASSLQLGESRHKIKTASSSTSTTFLADLQMIHTTSVSTSTTNLADSLTIQTASASTSTSNLSESIANTNLVDSLPTHTASTSTSRTSLLAETFKGETAFASPSTTQLKDPHMIQPPNYTLIPTVHLDQTYIIHTSGALTSSTSSTDSKNIHSSPSTLTDDSLLLQTTTSFSAGPEDTSTSSCGFSGMDDSTISLPLSKDAFLFTSGMGSEMSFSKPSYHDLSLLDVSVEKLDQLLNGGLGIGRKHTETQTEVKSESVTPEPEKDETGSLGSTLENIKIKLMQALEKAEAATESPELESERRCRLELEKQLRVEIENRNKLEERLEEVSKAKRSRLSDSASSVASILASIVGRAETNLKSVQENSTNTSHDEENDFLREKKHHLQNLHQVEDERDRLGQELQNALSEKIVLMDLLEKETSEKHALSEKLYEAESKAESLIGEVGVERVISEELRQHLQEAEVKMGCMVENENQLCAELRKERDRLYKEIENIQVALKEEKTEKTELEKRVTDSSKVVSDLVLLAEFLQNSVKEERKKYEEAVLSHKGVIAQLKRDFNRQIKRAYDLTKLIGSSKSLASNDFFKRRGTLPLKRLSYKRIPWEHRCLKRVRKVPRSVLERAQRNRILRCPKRSKFMYKLKRSPLRRTWYKLVFKQKCVIHEDTLSLVDVTNELKPQYLNFDLVLSVLRRSMSQLEVLRKQAVATKESHLLKANELAVEAKNLHQEKSLLEEKLRREKELTERKKKSLAHDLAVANEINVQLKQQMQDMLTSYKTDIERENSSKREELNPEKMQEAMLEPIKGQISQLLADLEKERLRTIGARRKATEFNKVFRTLEEHLRNLASSLPVANRSPAVKELNLDPCDNLSKSVEDEVINVLEDSRASRRSVESSNHIVRAAVRRVQARLRRLPLGTVPSTCFVLLGYVPTLLRSLAVEKRRVLWLRRQLRRRYRISEKPKLSGSKEVLSPSCAPSSSDLEIAPGFGTKRRTSGFGCTSCSLRSNVVTTSQGGWAARAVRLAHECARRLQAQEVVHQTSVATLRAAHHRDIAAIREAHASTVSRIQIQHQTELARARREARAELRSSLRAEVRADMNAAVERSLAEVEDLHRNEMRRLSRSLSGSLRFRSGSVPSTGQQVVEWSLSQRDLNDAEAEQIPDQSFDQALFPLHAVDGNERLSTEMAFWSDDSLVADDTLQHENIEFGVAKERERFLRFSKELKTEREEANRLIKQLSGEWRLLRARKACLRAWTDEVEDPHTEELN